MTAEEYLRFYSKVLKKLSEGPTVPEAIAGVEKEFQFEFTDLQAENFYLRFHEGKITLEPGKSLNPATTVIIDTKSWDGIVDGSLNPMVTLVF